MMTANTIETGGTENLFAYFLDWLVLSLKWVWSCAGLHKDRFILGLKVSQATG